MGVDVDAIDPILMTSLFASIVADTKILVVSFAWSVLAGEDDGKDGQEGGRLLNPVA